MYVLFSGMVFPKSSRSSHILTKCIVVLFIASAVLECRGVLGKNTKSRSRKLKSNENGESNFDEDIYQAESDLFGFNSDTPEDLENEMIISGLSRKIRSPLDEDIDEVEDDNDDSDEDEETSKPAEKHVVSNSPSSTTTANLAKTPKATPPLITIKPAVDSSKTTSVNSANSSSASLAIKFHQPPSNAGTLSGSTSGPLPSPSMGFKQSGFVPGGKFPLGFPPPPHGKPHSNGTIHFGGKLPPHLLKHIPTPKPPAKKGELHLPDDYNNLVIPKLNLGRLIGIDSYSAVPVLVFLNIRSVRDIDEEMETLNLDLDLVIEWVDGFLFDPISAATTRQEDITLNPIFLKKIWRPDIYIDEIVKVKRTSLMNKPLKLKFNPSNGFISYTTRLAVQLSCDMIYKYYPADTHHCEFTFRSYSYFSKDLQLSWLGTGVYLQDPYDPNFDLTVESIDNIKLPQTFRKLTNDTFDGLQFTILARRKLSFHMVQTYLPSIFFIVITWLCFLVPARMVEARIGISMTTLLTLTSMFASVRESTPIVSYVKAIDVWMVCCIFFVFLTLLEFAILVWLRARREDAEEEKLDFQRKVQETKNGQKEVPFSRRSSSASLKLQKYETFAEFTEKYAFIIFSIVFIVFNVIYWSWLLAASNYFDWNVNSTLNADLD